MPNSDLPIGQFADVLVKDLRPGDWRTLNERISGAAAALRHMRDTREPGIHPDAELPSIVGVAIDKLGTRDVSDALQASIWTLSDRAAHRALGDAWLHAHPAEQAAPEREVADGHVALTLAGGSVHDAADRLLSPMPPRRIAFRAIRDDEAGVWSATSDDHITAEAPSREALLDRLRAIVPDVLEAREGRTGPLTLVVNWQELRTVDQSTVAIA